MSGRTRVDFCSVKSKLKVLETRQLDISAWVYQTHLTQDDALKALATFCAWVHLDEPEAWLRFTCDQQAALVLPRNCAMDVSVPIVRVVSYAARFASLLNCRKSLVASLMKLPTTSRTGAGKTSGRTPIQSQSSSIPAGFQTDFYQLCSQALEFKELQAAIEASCAEDLQPVALLSAEVQALAAEVAKLCEDYNALASRLEQEGILEKLKSVNAECETFKANMQNLKRERTTAQESYMRGKNSLKQVQNELREQNERIQRSEGLLAKYSERISQSPEELSKKYENLLRDKAGIYSKEAAEAHRRLRSARLIRESLPETRSSLKELTETLDARSATVKTLDVEMARRSKLQHQIREMETEHMKKRNQLDIQQAILDEQANALTEQTASLESRIEGVRRSQERLSERESAANARIDQINKEMAKLREEDMREMRLERQLASESDEMRRHLTDLRDCLPSLLSQFDAEIQAHQDKIMQDLADVNDGAVRYLESLIPADYMKLRALKQGRICGC